MLGSERVKGILPSSLNTNQAQSCLAAKKQDMHTIIDVGLTEKAEDQEVCGT